MPYRESLLLLILILPYFHGCQVYPSVIFYDHPFQIIPPPFFLYPLYQIKYPNLKTNTQNSKPNLMWLKIQYIYTIITTPTFFLYPGARGWSPKSGSGCSGERKKSFFADDENIIFPILPQHSVDHGQVPQSVRVLHYLSFA